MSVMSYPIYRNMSLVCICHQRNFEYIVKPHSLESKFHIHFTHKMKVYIINTHTHTYHSYMFNF